VATSDPVITTITRSRAAQRASARSRLVNDGTVLQALADTVTAFFGIWITYFICAERLKEKGLSLNIAHLSGLAAIVTIMCALTGAYSRDTTPIHIAETEGLVRGTCYAAVLAVMACLHSNPTLSLIIVPCGVVVTGLLVLERDMGHVLAEWIRKHKNHVWEEPVLRAPRAVAGLDNETDRVRVESGCSNPTAAMRRRSSPHSLSLVQVGVRSEAMVVGEGAEEEPATCSSQRVAESGNQHEADCRTLGRRELSYGVLNNDYRKIEPPANLIMKRAIDAVGSIILLIALSPLLVAIAVLVRAGSKGAVLFRHWRVGRDGAEFRMWKFRSMRVETPQYERSPLSDSDPRLTRVGRILRRLSVDELPQLINVLKGDMSLVGPRPEMPFIVEGYDVYESRRLQAKPGITGLWQISPARAMPIHENLWFDLYYIEHKNIFLDCAILLRTITAVVRGVGAT
jgi:lipopolysaccharide/colanic/teichoic acid biosynthesis glycosyltransferase